MCPANGGKPTRVSLFHMHFAPTGPIVHRRSLSLLLAAALVATLLAVAAPTAQAQANQPPIADAGPDEVHPVGPTQRTLHGSRSFDIDNDIQDLDYDWEVVTPAYAWLFITPSGSPLGSEAFFIAPSLAEVNRYGETITFRLTVTDPLGGSASDTVTFRFERPPTLAIAVTAGLPVDDPVDLDGDGFVEDEEIYTINAVLGRPGQGGNSEIEWDVKEGSFLTLRGIGSSTSTGRLRYSWQKLSVIPGRFSADFNVPANRRNSQTFSILLPDDLEAGQGIITHYSLIVTSPTGLQAQSTVRINVMDEAASPEVEIELANNRQPVQDANALDPDAPTQRFVVQPGASVDLVAAASDGDGVQTRTLIHSWSGTGVEPSPNNPEDGPTSRATFTVPANAVIGQSFTATLEVADATNRVGRDQIIFIVAINVPPEAIAPRNFPTEDGPRGGTDRRGTVFVRGSGTDKDGDLLSYRWVQVDDQDVPLENPTVELMNTDSATVSFASPQVAANGQREIHLALTVADQWGVGDTDYVTVTILGRNERPIADAGTDQIVEPGAIVQLDGTNSIDPDPGTFLEWSWAYTGLATTPPISERPLTPYQEIVALRGFVPDGTDYSDLDPLVNGHTPLPSFTAPELGGLVSVQLTFTLTLFDRAGGRDTDTVTVTVTGRFFSGNIDGPDFCTNLSLGGPRTYAFDSDGDSVADVCSLPYTRREAVARQNALVTLASLDQPRFQAAVLAACGQLTGDFGDDQDDLDADACETRRVADPPPPVDPALANQFFSGVIDGPDFCTNLSLGGPRTYAFDSDGDDVADVCSLPTTRREAVARQNALETFTTPQAVFNSAVALACRELGSITFEGDAPRDLARDACA